MLRLQNNVPDIYVNQSRDFQLLCRLYDCINNGVKYDIDTISKVIDTDFCNSKLLSLLQTKIGFLPDTSFNNDIMRIVLKAFPHIIKDKGSLIGIKEAVYTFFKAYKINTIAKIQIINKTVEESEIVDKYSVEIGIRAGQMFDTTLLEELLKYILPTGYTYNIYYFTELAETNSIGYHKNNIFGLYVTDKKNAETRNAADNNTFIDRVEGAVGFTNIYDGEDL